MKVKGKKLCVFLVVVLIFSILCPSVSFANEEKFESRENLFGWREEELSDAIPDYISANNDNGEVDEIPSKVDLSENNYFPSIGLQLTGSCVAWSTVYYQFTYEVARMNNWNAREDKSKTFSPKYVYNYINQGKNEECYLADCYNFLSCYGSLKWSDFPENSRSLGWYNGSLNKVYDAFENRVVNRKSYYFAEVQNRKNTISPVVKGYDDEILYNMKKLLNDGHCLSITTGSSYDDVEDKCFSKLSNGEMVWLYTVGDYNHQVTVVGYDDDIWFDMNGDGIQQPYEKGAFKIANSWGQNWKNNGFVWVLYDALNLVSSCSEENFNPSNRIPFMGYNLYSVIEVARTDVPLSVEVTIEQKNRGDLKISVGNSDTEEGMSEVVDTNFYKLYVGDLDFSGKYPGTYQEHTYVIDYSKNVIDRKISSIFDGYDKYYWINIEDVEANNDAVTTVKRVCWRDKDRNIIKEIYPNDTFDGATKSYESKTIPASRLELNKNSSFLTVGNTEQLTATVTPENTYNSDVEWQSDNKDVVSVDQTGKVTAVGKGTATVSAKTTDGSGLVSSCTYKVVNVAVSEISMIREKVTLHENQTVTAKCSVLPSNADDKTVSWVSDDEEIVTISQDGIITAKKKGSAYIRAVANDGSGVSCRCLIEVIDDHGDTPENATNIIVHSPRSGKIDVAGDADYFGFTAKYTGTFIFYTTGNTDTVGFLYDSDGNLLTKNDQGGISKGNFAFKCDLVNGRKYYIKVVGSNNATGDYNFIVTRAIYSASVEGMNQDARHVQMEVEASSILTRFRVWIGDTNYDLEKPTSGDLDVTVKGVHFKVTFESKNNGYSTVWNVHAKVPSSTEEQLVYFAFNRGALSGIESESIEGFLPYKSSIKTGIDPNSNLQALLNSMKKSGYTLKAKKWDNSDIAVNSSVKAATGMKIIKTDNKTGKIVEVYYLVLFGDVTGNGVVGDGEITVTDALQVLQEAIDKSVLPTEIARLAADVDHDGEITQTDATMINQAAVNKITIDQSYVIVDVPDECVYNYDVEF